MSVLDVTDRPWWLKAPEHTPSRTAAIGTVRAGGAVAGVVVSPGAPSTGPSGRRDDDKPRTLDPGLPPGDRLFHGVSRSIGFLVLAITGSIGVFLALKAVPTFRTYGFGFLTTAKWSPGDGHVGILAVLLGTIVVATMALCMAVPLAFATALYITEYAPPALQSTLVSVVDLMAAVPSIIWGLWVRDLLGHKVVFFSHWVSTYFGWIPIFKVKGDPHAPNFQQSNYGNSAFIASIAVAMMVMPMACAVMRQVFSLTPQGEKEAALALGATRWDMVRSVVLPFGKGGIIGGSMLALGRALGETIAVLLIISPTFSLSVHPLQVGANTISALIAGRFSEASTQEFAALLTAGFVLFLMTLMVNTIAATIVSRSRSGAGTDA